MSRWKCSVCGYIYNEATGESATGTPEGTIFGDLPEDWTCPVCGEFPEKAGQSSPQSPWRLPGRKSVIFWNSPAMRVPAVTLLPIRSSPFPEVIIMQLNGVDTDALRATMEKVNQDSKEGHLTFRATTAWASGAHSVSSVRKFSLEADEPLSLLGTDLAPNAVEQVLAALGGCLTVGVVYQAALAGISLESLAFEIEGYLDIRGFFGDDEVEPGYQRIMVTVRMQAKAPRAELENLLARAARTSPVMDIIARGVPVALQMA
jgi:rubredoxin/uncharacterized OsmC-like protein